MKRTYPKPKIGDQYGRWTVVSIPKNADCRTKILCQCTCGNAGTPRASSLTCGHSRGCGVCHTRRWQKASVRTHAIYDFVPDLHRHRIAVCMASAIRRCHNPRDTNYKNYGQRGISVFLAWRRDHVLFVRYLMTLGGWDNPNLTIDRIDNDGNYEPGNLRFVTHKENCQNRR